jgi:SAM-dependent methyltransferase
MKEHIVTFFESKYSPGFFVNRKRKKEYKRFFSENFTFQKSDGYQKALDIGFGSKEELFTLTEFLPKTNIVGIDIYSKKKMKKLARQCKEVNTISILEGDINNLDFEEGYFNYVFSLNSFYFASDPALAIDKIDTILGKKGVFVLALDMYDDITSKDSELFTSNEIPYSIVKKDTIIDLLHKKKFKDINMFPDNTNLFIQAVKK